MACMHFRIASCNFAVLIITEVSADWQDSAYLVYKAVRKHWVPRYLILWQLVVDPSSCVYPLHRNECCRWFTASCTISYLEELCCSKFFLLFPTLDFLLPLLLY